MPVKKDLLIGGRGTDKNCSGPIRYDAVKNGWNLKGPEVREQSGDKLDYDDNDLCMTSQPSYSTGTTLEEDPDAYTECFINGWLKRKIMSTPGYPSPVQHPPQVNHRISESPGKGLGMFATRDMHAGELVLAERPLIVVARSFRVLENITIGSIDPMAAAQAGRQEANRLLETLADKLEPSRKAQLMSLANSNKFSGNGPIFEIIMTNGFYVGEVQGPGNSQHTVVCNELSRMNHSCCANVTRTWDMASFSMRIRASRDIKKDEEITVDYGDSRFASAKTRQKALAPYDMTCTCSSCTNSASSDPLRAMCAKIEAQANAMMPWTGDLPKSLDVKPLLDDLIAFVKEGLQDSNGYGYTLFMLMKTYVALGDVKNTKRYEDKVNIWALCQGAEPTKKFADGFVAVAKKQQIMRAMNQVAGKKKQVA